MPIQHGISTLVFTVFIQATDFDIFPHKYCFSIYFLCSILFWLKQPLFYFWFIQYRGAAATHQQQFFTYHYPKRLSSVFSKTSMFPKTSVFPNTTVFPETTVFPKTGVLLWRPACSPKDLHIPPKTSVFHLKPACSQTENREIYGHYNSVFGTALWVVHDMMMTNKIVGVGSMWTFHIRTFSQNFPPNICIAHAAYRTPPGQPSVEQLVTSLNGARTSNVQNVLHLYNTLLVMAVGEQAVKVK